MSIYIKISLPTFVGHVGFTNNPLSNHGYTKRTAAFIVLHRMKYLILFIEYKQHFNNDNRLFKREKK